MSLAKLLFIYLQHYDFYISSKLFFHMSSTLCITEQCKCGKVFKLQNLNFLRKIIKMITIKIANMYTTSMDEELVTDSSTLAWRNPWTEEPDGWQSMVLQIIGHTWVTYTYTHISNNFRNRIKPHIHAELYIFCF